MTGVWPVTYQRILKGWGSLLEQDQVFRSTSWPLEDPAQFDEIAKQQRIGWYHRVWNAVDAVKSSAIRNHVVTASFHVTKEWQNPNEGRLDFVQSENEFLGGHTLGISTPSFLSPTPLSWTGDDFIVFKNTWGRAWGNRGWGAMSYDFFDRENYESWAWPLDSKVPNASGTGIQHLSWKIKGDSDRQFYFYDILDVDADDRLAWASVVFRRGEIHVEELFVKPQARGKGHGKALMDMIYNSFNEAIADDVPVKFWIPFADVDDQEKLGRVNDFFRNYGIIMKASPLKSAAYLAVLGSAPAQLPPVKIPPKPSYVFKDATVQTVKWKELQGEFSVGDDFSNSAKRVFQRHAETLKRLA